MTTIRTATAAALVLGFLLAPVSGSGQEISGTYRGVSRAVKFDISPPLRSIPSATFYDDGRLMVDPDRTPALPPSPFVADPVLQSESGGRNIPGTLVSFDGPSNSSNVSPPDSVGDVGPEHYVAMTNLSFAVYSKDGTPEYGPVANNTLWTDFGGDCEFDNDGDPVVLYDQLADRWLLTQFTASGPTYYNCVALSTSGDPAGIYFRWAFSTGSAFPDYPKYGVWPDAYYIATREFAGSTFSGIGAYAVDREQMLVGNASPRMISIIVPPTIEYQTGDGLLPADLDGTTLPPEGSPNYWVGSMDDNGQYNAPQDALSFWEYHVDWDNPPSSTFNLVATIPTAPFDSAFPCTPYSRDCIPQPGTSNKIDIQSYRQRVIHRLAYRNFGSHESLVTNQSVEAAPSIGGIRWYELRNPGASAVIHQQGTYAPGATDGIHRWMGSAAMDSAGNIGLGFSASDGSTTYPSVWYTGRLAGDPSGTMTQGEGSIIDGIGSQTSSDRWGDYSSMNIDPTDDCTFWYVNQYLPTTSTQGWRLRVGSFKFDECGTPDFILSSTPGEVEICAGSDPVVTLNVGAIADFSNAVSLAVSQSPLGTTTSLSLNPVTPPGSSTLSIEKTVLAKAGHYTVVVNGDAFSSPGHSVDIGLDIFDRAPEAPVLTSPPDGATNQPVEPTFSWNAGGQSSSFTIEIATDVDFTNIVDSATQVGTSYTPAAPLASNTRFFWRVRATNPCETGPDSMVFDLVTLPLPGDCPMNSTMTSLYSYGFEEGLNGWTSSGTASTWAQSSARVNSGTYSWMAVDSSAVSDQYFVSPPISMPAAGFSSVLRFWNYQEMESNGTDACYDGGILEVATDGVNWTQLVDPSLLTEPYDGPVNLTFGNPLAGLDAWCGDPQPWLESIVDLDAYAGQTVQFRFRLGTDSMVGREGWYIDDVVVQSCLPITGLFADGFESGNTSAWSEGQP